MKNLLLTLVAVIMIGIIGIVGFNFAIGVVTGLEAAKQANEAAEEFYEMGYEKVEYYFEDLEDGSVYWEVTPVPCAPEGIVKEF